MAYCIDHDLTLETLPLEEYQKFHALFAEDVYQAISLDTCVNGRKVPGGPAPENVEKGAQRVLALMQDGVWPYDEGGETP